MTLLQFKNLINEANYPIDACVSLERDYGALLENPACGMFLKRAEQAYRQGELNLYEGSEELVRLGKEASVHPYALEILFYLHLAPVLREKYREMGLNDSFFAGMMQGILCKLYECHRLYGVWGSFVAIWFSRFFNLSLYAIGRFECCLMRADKDYLFGEGSVKKGSLLIDVHIPSRGKLTPGECAQSYRAAAAFFAPKLQGERAVFHCESWLLADYVKQGLDGKAGIAAFADRYTLVERTPDEGDLWRIFYLHDYSDPDTLPEDTALQRLFKKRLQKNLPLYGGRGLFIYEDDEK